MEKILRSPRRLGAVVPSIGLMLRERQRSFGDLPVYREKRRGAYEIRTWNELCAEVVQVGSSLVALGLREGDVVGSYSRNRREMLVLELAAMSLGAVFCPIFSEYPARSLEYVLEHSGIRFLAVSDRTHLEEVRKTQASRRLERVFLMDFEAEADARVSPFDSLYAREASMPRKEWEGRLERVRPDQPCLLMYTSGTTGRPKGVLLSHQNILSQRKAMALLWELGPKDRFLSYLPWHHSFGGIFELFGALYSGALLTLDESYGKNIPLLIENFKRTQPTVYFSVPSIYQALVTEAQGSKVLEREIFHAELRFVFTAAAPLPGHLAEYFRKKGISVLEGWGLTETSPCVTVTPLGVERRPGWVGTPLPGVEVRLAPDGEILVRGPNVMLGYHKDPELTSRVLGAEGWFHTGDFGEISRKGLSLKCRRDGMFKLTTGQMVISQQVENALAASPLIRYAVVFGSGEDFVGAILFPDRAALERTGGENGESGLRRRLRLEVEKAARAVSEKYARPKAFVLAREEPSLENGQLTPTLKIVKSKVLQDYAPYVKAVFRPRLATPEIRKEVIPL